MRKARRATVGVLAATLAAVLAAGFTAAAATAPAGERPPAVAGQFYSSDPARLAAEIGELLARAKPPQQERPVALVAPHAGYVYCGAILANAWRQAAGRDYGVVVLLGSNHAAPGLAGAAVWPDGAWRTPLGRAAVDADAARALLAADPDCVAATAPHAREHSLEVQVPFAQTVLPGVPILPVLIGSDDPAFCARLGRALAVSLRDRRPLIVASSDLSHYPARRDAVAVDRATLAAVASLDAGAVRRTIREQMGRGVDGLATCACGEAPILVALAAAKELGGVRGEVIAYANSADVPQGDPWRVVGYGAVAIFAAAAPDAGTTTAGSLSAADRGALLALARETIAGAFTGDVPRPTAAGASLSVRRGAFVTLKEDGELRGCIGHLAEDLPLLDVVREMATQAAFHDPRFPPLRRDELPRCVIEISVLTPARPVGGPAEIVAGRDGVILRKGGRSAVFLPQVATEQGWDVPTLLSHLALKAGLPADAWRAGAQLLTFQAEVFGETDRR